MQALAQPLLTTIAAARPPEAASCSRETSTGAACARLVVKTAAALAGTSRDDQREIARARRLDAAGDARRAEARAAR